MRDVAQNQIMGVFSNQEIQIEKNNIMSSFLDWVSYLPKDYWDLNPTKDFDFDNDHQYPPYTRSPFFFSKKKKVYVYKFRAECEHDIDKLKKILKGDYLVWTITGQPFPPDRLVEIATALTLNEMHDAIRQVQDGHVMLQTISLKENYTGERDYDLW